jgi:hypothetical protein
VQTTTTTMTMTMTIDHFCAVEYRDHYDLDLDRDLAHDEIFVASNLNIY